VNAVSNGDIAILSSAPLSRLELRFADLNPFILSRPSPDAEAELTWGEHHFTIPAMEPLTALPEWARQAVREAQGADDDIESSVMEAARESGIPFSEFKEVRDLVTHSEVLSTPPDAPSWFEELRAAFPVLFVTDQRLVVDSPGTARPSGGARPQRRTTARFAVEQASRKISEQMRRVDSAYARVSQQQDRRFPREVIRAMSQSKDVSAQQLQTLLKEVDERRESLRAVGLLDSEQSYEPEIAASSLQQESVLPVIATFLESALEKLAVLEDLANRLQVFRQFLDRRFSGKAMELSRQEGVRFRLESGHRIRPMQLSSGEQQMMVLAYEILFSSESGTLVIVDEPEISLHVLWQDTLIDDLSNMGGANQLQFLLATHSPVLLASHPKFGALPGRSGRRVSHFPRPEGFVQSLRMRRRGLKNDVPLIVVEGPNDRQALFPFLTKNVQVVAAEGRDQVLRAFDSLETPLRRAVAFIVDCDGGLPDKYKGHPDLVITTNRDVEADLDFELEAFDRVGLEVCADFSSSAGHAETQATGVLKASAELAAAVGLIQSAARLSQLPTRVVDRKSRKRRKFRISDVTELGQSITNTGEVPNSADLAAMIADVTGWDDQEQKMILEEVARLEEVDCESHGVHGCSDCKNRHHCNGHHFVEGMCVVLAAKHGQHIKPRELNRSLRIAARKELVPEWGVARRLGNWAHAEGVSVVGAH
jgi:predicted ABC-type transport system involved in lysophospholipase L1 biosynthesis ATPase subunit